VGEGGIGGEIGVDRLLLLSRRALGEGVDDGNAVVEGVVHSREEGKVSGGEVVRT